MPKFRIVTLGCKVNQAESEEIRKRLGADGWHLAGPAETPDVCIINTCAVTQKAAMQSRQAARRSLHSHPGATVVVTGCYAQTDPQALAGIAGIDYIVAQDGKARLAELLAGDTRRKQPRAVRLQGSGPAAGDFGFRTPVQPAARTRPFFKLQDGCDAHCTYCVVPQARGSSRSMPFRDALDGLGRAFAAGFHEVVLTGIHLGRYGLDLTPPRGLAELLRAWQARQIPGRIRLSSIEPLELTDEILQIAAGSESFCRHFHIPLQSADPGILARMGRPYAPQDFSARIARIRELMPDAAIGADVIAGFPGESDAAFENTLRFVGEQPLSYLHVFPFSARPGTAAWGFRPKVAAERIKRRCEILRDLGREKRSAFHAAFVGRKVRVLVEGRRDPRSGCLKGVSSNYLPVLFSGPDELRNTLVPLTITGAGPQALTGEAAPATGRGAAGE